MSGKYGRLLILGLILAMGMGALCLAAEENKDLPPADGQMSPAKHYLLAYDSMTTADWLLKREMNEEAVMLYNEALNTFRRLSSDYPLWQTNLVAFRINYCRNEIDKLSSPKKADSYLASARHQASKPVSASDLRMPAEAPRPRGSLRRSVAGGADSVPTHAAKPDEPAGGKELADMIQKAEELEKKSEHRESLALYREVLTRDNQYPLALAGAGRCLLKLGMADQARSLLLQWSVIPSPQNSVNLLLALIYCYDKQFAKAIKLVEIVLNEDNSNGAAHVIMGVALAGTGQTDAAMSEMQKALEIDPRLSEAHYNLAGLTLKRDPKRRSTARAYYQNALKFGASPDPELEKRLEQRSG